MTVLAKVFFMMAVLACLFKLLARKLPVLKQPVIIVRIRDNISAPVFVAGLAVSRSIATGMAAYAFRHLGELDLLVFPRLILLLVAGQARNICLQVRLVGKLEVGISWPRQAADNVIRTGMT